MLFPTLTFALFFIAVFTLAWILQPHAEPRKMLLLAASYLFYGWWDWRFMALLAGSSVANYLGGLLLGRTKEDRSRRWIVAAMVAANLAVLGFFKYYGFFLDSLTDLLLKFGLQRDMPFLEIILPIGISFFTFQGISYVVDVYRGHVKPVSSPIDLFLYISFFPQLVAGPIVRGSDFLPQLSKPPQLTRVVAIYGFILILAGMLKKTVVAHYLAVDLVDPVFVDPTSASSADLVGAHYAYAIQVYCDFSGYSDIAIGVAALLGFRFRKNFDRPFAATSMQQLWQRWHISLSTWLRDYLYRALRGKKREAGWRMHRNILLTMLLGGLWHGASWTFVIWGAILGAALVIERVVKGRYHEWRGQISARKSAPDVHVSSRATQFGLIASAFVGWFMTFHVFTLAAIFFRSPDLEVATSYFEQMFSWTGSVHLFSPFLLILTAGSVAVQFLPGNTLEKTAEKLRNMPASILGLLFGGGLVLIEFIGPEGVAPFVYFQF
ncbi:MBOAT family O-acyltransferase [Pseudorhodoplanes sinuspersici]|uniref:Probable alginate O-acetylase AlgI n=1 Tax=Pseudorhodoplanes sinuspersici TaxID=1235591 RepID=A0A1W6ZMH7_9HYPH|nr:MBOAT family O-acyltransferase [Pseudorhodoplanes sinuspersici]ARP98522.1 membrane-bound O-acyltransferase family protein [Pseudorhodoplanes sinuspersici]RKE65887.1 D-alanyl-lipoteichoic acid acyltransferase DltB (MBOAT superfamily) [Pseudorhodoplanes sinuspersici]